MLMLRSFRVAMIAALSTVLASASVLAEGPLDLIPQDASIVVRLKSPEKTIAKVGNFVNQVQPGFGFFIQSQAPALGVAISNTTLGGVDLKQDWYVAAFPKQNGEPDVIFVIPATDPDAMKEAVGETFSFAVKDSWVAYSMNPEATKRAQACIDGDAESLKIGRQAGDVFEENDLSVFVNVSSITSTYEKQLKEAERELERGLSQFDAEEVDVPPGLNKQALRDLLESLGKAVLQAVRDADAVVAGVGVSEEALTIDELLLVKVGSDSSKFLAKNPASDLALLGKLPQGQAGYMGLSMNATELAQWGLGLAEKLMTDEAPDEVKKGFEEAKEKLKDAKFGDFVSSFGVESGGDDGLFRSVTLSEVKPTSIMRELTRNMSKYGGIVQTPGIEQEITVEENAETYGTLKADVIRVKQEFSPEADPLGMAQQITDLFYGPDGMTQRIVTTDSLVIQTAGGGQDTMKKALSALESTSGVTGAVKEGRGLALDKANLLAMIDLPNFIVQIGAGVAKTGMIPIPLPVEQIEQLKIPASYLVISVGTQKDGLRARTALPVKMFKGFMEIKKFADELQQQQFDNGF